MAETDTTSTETTSETTAPGTQETTTAPEVTGAVDLSFVPEQFKAQDGTPDPTAFRTAFDELATFKAQADEAAAALPQSAEDYAFAVPEGFEFPQGFNPAVFQMPVMGEDGKQVMENGVAKTRDMEPGDLINPDDPDLGDLKAIMHKHGAKPELLGELAGLLAKRELRGMVQAHDDAQAQRTALGANAQSRIDTVKRAISARLPADQATALMNDLTSADGVRAMEAILKTSTAPVSPAPGTKPDLDNMSARDLITLGMQSRVS